MTSISRYRGFPEHHRSDRRLVLPDGAGLDAGVPGTLLQGPSTLDSMRPVVELRQLPDHGCNRGDGESNREREGLSI